MNTPTSAPRTKVIEVLQGWQKAFEEDGWTEGPAVGSWGSSLRPECAAAFLVAVRLLCLDGEVGEEIRSTFERALEDAKALDP